ncbi:MAG: NUDIX hydrolase [Erysipelotrichaceae bacterium]|nr:NUDIX hydrolase [Erysipelotrichaceae bacterium]
MSHFERTISEETKFVGRIFSVHVDEVELENGNTATREVIEHDGGVCILPVTEDDKVYMVRQYRYPLGMETFELPAGKRNGNENPRYCGLRELREEIGMDAGTFVPLTMMYSSPGCFTETIYIYLAKDLVPVDQKPDEDEFLDVYLIPLEEALQMINRGEILDAKSQLALLKYAYDCQHEYDEYEQYDEPEEHLSYEEAEEPQPVEEEPVLYYQPANEEPVYFHQPVNEDSVLFRQPVDLPQADLTDDELNDVFNLLNMDTDSEFSLD